MTSPSDPVAIPPINSTSGIIKTGSDVFLGPTSVLETVREYVLIVLLTI